jgi:hypothetical protein
LKTTPTREEMLSPLNVDQRRSASQVKSPMKPTENLTGIAKLKTSAGKMNPIDFLGNQIPKDS